MRFAGGPAANMCVSGSNLGMRPGNSLADCWGSICVDFSGVERQIVMA
jgi:hypothetical protein